MSRGPKINRVNIGKVLEKLYEGPKTWTELKNETQINGRLVSRILADYLSPWGLAYKTDDGKWAFIQEKQVYSSHEEYSIAVQHSRDVCGDLFSYVKLKNDGVSDFWALSGDVDEIAFIEKGEPSIYLHMIRSHLRTGYGSVWESLVSYERLSKRHGYLGILNLDLERNFTAGRDRELLSSERAAEAMGERGLSETDRELLESLKKGLVGDLAKIQWDVLAGTPMKGYCEHCPHRRVEILTVDDQQ